MLNGESQSIKCKVQCNLTNCYSRKHLSLTFCAQVVSWDSSLWGGGPESCCVGTSCDISLKLG